MTERDLGYEVVVYSRIHPSCFRGPRFLKNIFSDKSEKVTSSMGSYPGMPLEKAQKVADETNYPGIIFVEKGKSIILRAEIIPSIHPNEKIFGMNS
jgi:hypothetical protein